MGVQGGVRETQEPRDSDVAAGIAQCVKHSVILVAWVRMQCPASRMANRDRSARVVDRVQCGAGPTVRDIDNYAEVVHRPHEFTPKGCEPVVSGSHTTRPSRATLVVRELDHAYPEAVERLQVPKVLFELAAVLGTEQNAGPVLLPRLSEIIACPDMNDVVAHSQQLAGDSAPEVIISDKPFDCRSELGWRLMVAQQGRLTPSLGAWTWLIQRGNVGISS